jgi:hypothetical protein
LLISGAGNRGQTGSFGDSTTQGGETYGSGQDQFGSSNTGSGFSGSGARVPSDSERADHAADSGSGGSESMT